MKKLKQKKIRSYTYFGGVIFLIIAVAYLISLVVPRMICQYFYRSAALLSALALSIILFTVLAVILNKCVFSPLARLSRAMHQVAQGDFSIRLETRNKFDEIQALYNNFNAMAGELAAMDVLQTDFVSNVSHEFKTPINAIEGYAMLLQENCSLSHEQTEYAEKILLNTNRLSDLVSNILLLSKLDNQTIPFKQERFRMDEQIRQAIVYLEPKWTEKEIEFDADLDECFFTGNEHLLLHVWLNLIDNAIKFSPKGGSILLRLKTSAQGIAISVQDSGPGIVLKDKNRIFDKFYQADTSRKDEGNGLGLALVKQIVAVHKGSIEVENCEPNGCKFTVILPVSI